MNTSPMVNQAKKNVFTAETKNNHFHGLSSLLMGPVWLHELTYFNF